MKIGAGEPLSYRYLLYSHDGLGLGHTRRNLAIADALMLADPGATVLAASGLDEFPRLGVPDGVDVLKLPGIRKLANGVYEPRRLRVETERLFSMRAALLRAAVESLRPHVLLADKHPFGPAGELREALEALRQHGGLAVLGLRDILDSPRLVRSEWSDDLSKRVSQTYERLLIYGCQDVFDLPREYAFSESLVAMSHFCGYVVNQVRKTFREADAPPAELVNHPLQSGKPHRLPVVVATPGGGEDGLSLLHAFILAAKEASWNAVVVTGPDTTPENRQRLRAEAAAAGVTFRSFVPNLAAWFAHADGLVCMGGYNTLLEGLHASAPIVCIPRVAPRLEQLIRAEAFQALGLVRVVKPQELTIERLRGEVDAVVAVSRSELGKRIGQVLDFDGAAKAAAELLRVAGSATMPAGAGHRPRTADAAAALRPPPA